LKNTMRLPASIFVIIVALLAAGFFCDRHLLSKGYKIRSATACYFYVKHVLACRHKAEDTVVKGKNGWLFVDEEIQSLYSVWPNSNLEKISQFSNGLKYFSVTLVVVPVPNKIDFYPEKLVPFYIDNPNPNRAVFINRLRKKGVFVVDVFPSLKETSKSGPVFYKGDSHWNDAGIRSAAKKISDEVRNLSAGIPCYSNVFHEAVHGECLSPDLLCKLTGGVSAPCETTIVTSVLQNNMPFFSADSSEILIIGDSFNRHHCSWGAHIGAHIAYDLGYPVRILCADQLNRRAPSFFKNSTPGKLRRYKIIIWIFSERALMSSFFDAQLPSE
jgi:hypothetical protein